MKIELMRARAYDRDSSFARAHTRTRTHTRLYKLARSLTCSPLALRGAQVPINYIEQIPDVETIPYFDAVKDALSALTDLIGAPVENGTTGHDDYA